jgi:hypothetical protein
MKIRAMWAELFHSGGRKDQQAGKQADMTKLTVGFRNFANAPKDVRTYTRTCFVRGGNLAAHIKRKANVFH